MRSLTIITVFTLATYCLLSYLKVEMSSETWLGNYHYGYVTFSIITGISAYIIDKVVKIHKNKEEW